jgi:hypothetical protein
MSLGLPITLSGFNQQQIQTLAQRYHLNDWSIQDAEQLMIATDGHPHLIQLALYNIWRQKLTIEQWLQPSPPLSQAQENLESPKTRSTLHPLYFNRVKKRDWIGTVCSQQGLVCG